MRTDRRKVGLRAAAFIATMMLTLPLTPAMAATLAGTEQVWQGGDWAVEATPYWCRAYPVAAEKNAGGIPAVALIQWDGKVYLELERQAHTDSEPLPASANFKIGDAGLWLRMNQGVGMSWIALDLTQSSSSHDLLAQFQHFDRFTVNQPAIVQQHLNQPKLEIPPYGQPMTYSLRGFKDAKTALDKCAGNLISEGNAGLDPMQRMAPNRTLQPKGYPGQWIPQTAYPRGAYVPVRKNTPRVCSPDVGNEPEPCRRERLQGTVGFTLTIGTRGMPTNCEVTSSSGHSELDDATCTNLIKRAKFVPATNAYGYPIESVYSNRFHWEVPSDTVPPQSTGQLPSVSSDKSRPARPKSMTSAPYPGLAPIYSPAETGMGFTMVVGPNGHPTKCDVTASSGFPEIDKAACDRLIKQVRFEPALDRNGRPTEGTYSHRVKLRRAPR